MKSPTALVLALVLGVAVAGQALAYAPGTSPPRPVKRPATVVAAPPPAVGSVATATQQAPPRRSPHPQRRPGSRVVTPTAIAVAVSSASVRATGPTTASAVVRSPPARSGVPRPGLSARQHPPPPPPRWPRPPPVAARHGAVRFVVCVKFVARRSMPSPPADCPAAASLTRCV